MILWPSIYILYNGNIDNDVVNATLSMQHCSLINNEKEDHYKSLDSFFHQWYTDLQRKEDKEKEEGKEEKCASHPNRVVRALEAILAYFRERSFLT